MVELNKDQPLTGSEADQNPIGDHIALIYETPEERLATVTPLIKVGLEKGELCLYISNEENDLDMVEALKAENIDVEKAVDNGGLILTSKQEMYFKLGHFDPEWTMRVIQNVADLAKSYGFTAMRLVSDMTWTQEKVPGVEHWPEYEAKMNVMNAGISLRMICQYDRKAFTPASLMVAIHTHPKVVYQGSVNKNAFYVPTEQLLSDDYSELELEGMLQSIRIHNKSEAELQNRELTIAEMRRQMESAHVARKKAEVAIDEHRTRFNDLAERASDWAWEMDENGVYTYCSPRVKDILGLRPEEVIGRTPLDLVSREEADHVSNLLTKTMTSRVPITALEKEARHKDGHVVFLEMNGMPQFDQAGTFVGYRGIDRDITGRKAAKQAIEESHKRIEESMAEVQERDHRIEALEVAISQLKASQLERDAAAATVKETLRASQMELTKAGESLGALRDALRSREDELNASKVIAEAKQNELEEQRAGLTLLRQNLDDKEAELTTIREGLSEAQRVLLTKESDLAELTSNYKTQSLELSGVKGSLSGVQEAIDRKEEELITLRQQVERLNADLGTTKEGLTSKEVELTQLMEQSQGTAIELEQRSQELASVKEELNSKLAELTEALGTARNLQASLDLRETELKGRQELLETRQQELDRAQAEIDRLQEELDTKGSALNDMIANYEGTKADLAALTEEVTRFQEDQIHLEQERDELTAFLLVREQELTELRSVVERTSNELQDRTTELRSSQQRLMEQKRELDREASQAEQRGLVLQLKDEELSTALVEEQRYRASTASMLSQVEQLGSDQNVNQTVIEGLREALIQREQWLATSKCEVGEWSAKAKAVSEGKNALVMDLDRLESELHTATMALEMQGSELTLERDQHQLTKEELVLRLQELEEIKGHHRMSKEELELRVQELTQVKEDHQLSSQQIVRLNGEIDLLNSKMNEREAELDQIRTEHQRSLYDLEQRSKELASAQEGAEATKVELEQQRDNLQMISGDLERRTEELAQVQQDLINKGSALTEALTTIDQLKGTLVSKEMELKDRGEELQGRQQETLNANQELGRLRDDLTTKVSAIENARLSSAAEVVHLQAVMDGMRAGLAVISPDGRVVKTNLALKSLLGTNGLEGRLVEDIWPGLDLSGPARLKVPMEGGDRELNALPSALMENGGGRETVLTFSEVIAPMMTAPQAERTSGEPSPGPQLQVEALDDQLTVILGSVSLAKEYVIPEGRMYSKLKQIENASMAARDVLEGQVSGTRRSAQRSSSTSPPLVKGKGRVLLMDDDENVLEATGDVLRHIGYTVEVARDGEEALALFKEAIEAKNPFDMAVLDLIIESGMGGQEVADRLRTEGFQTKLVATGPLGSSLLESDRTAQTFATVVPKPYQAEQLSQALAETLVNR